MSVNTMSRRNYCSWANLLPDILLSIVDHLDITTSIRLSVVCTSWASTICPCLPSFLPMRRDPPVPWLLISAKNSNMNINRTDLIFYDLSTNSYFTIWIPITSLHEHHWMCSYEGWLLTLDRELQLHLIKPLTGAHVLLPSKGIEKEHPKKVIMCHSPDNTNELLIFCLTHQGCLVSAKLGDESWTWKANSNMVYQDIVLHQGKLYAFSMDNLCYWNIPSSSTKVKVIGYIFTEVWTNYLLQWNSELVMLSIENEQMVSSENNAPNEVELHKLKPRDRGCSASRVLNLGDDALFFGANCSYAMSRSGHDDIQGNCIYFTNQKWRCFHNAEQFNPNHNFGRFDLGKQTFYKPCCPQDSPMHLPPPIWFWPC